MTFVYLIKQQHTSKAEENHNNQCQPHPIHLLNTRESCPDSNKIPNPKRDCSHHYQTASPRPVTYTSPPPNILARLPIAPANARLISSRIRSRFISAASSGPVHGFKFEFGGKQIIVRHVANRVLTWVDKFRAVGDTVVQDNPVHAGWHTATPPGLLSIQC